MEVKIEVFREMLAHLFSIKMNSILIIKLIVEVA